MLKFSISLTKILWVYSNKQVCLYQNNNNSNNKQVYSKKKKIVSIDGEIFIIDQEGEP